jgi:hypothetical protein
MLALDVASGRTTTEAGCRRAASLASGGVVGSVALREWFGTAMWIARQEDLWERGLLLGRLLVAALEVLSDDLSVRDRALCQSDWTEIAHLALVHRPDSALFASGGRAGEAALAAARGLGDGELIGQILYRLGTLHLDPFSRPYDAWWEEHRLWLSLAPPEDVEGIPEPRVALATAERYLREATAFRTGPALGYTLKALAQALQQGAFLGEPAEPDVLDQLCDRALRLLPDSDLPARIAVERLRFREHQ